MYVSLVHWWVLGKKSSLVSGNWSDENLPARTVKSVSEHIFFVFKIPKKLQTHTQTKYKRM